ncbi:MAG: hypothetical protein KTR20_04350 [Cellvibrionaceae bacterium]|nr:hypothetical protein [Cellvibrionaceae bacterium]
MSVIEGIYYNPDTGIDERRLIACDAEGRLLQSSSAHSPSPIRTEVFALGRVRRGRLITTDPMDLGETHAYTLLIVRKSGVASRREALEIQTSVDGERWLSAAGLTLESNLARYESANGRESFTLQGRPVGQFVRLVYQNGSRTQHDLVLELTALAGP